MVVAGEGSKQMLWYQEVFGCKRRRSGESRKLWHQEEAVGLEDSSGGRRGS